MADTNGGGFGPFVPGFEFLQNLARQTVAGLAPGAAPSVAPVAAPAAALPPGFGGWLAPTFSVEELDKRIAELKTVQFWLDQNARALAATVQALEVQRMTLATLQGMNVKLGDMTQAIQAHASDTLNTMAGMAGLGASGAPAPAPVATPAPAPAPEPTPAPAASAAAPSPATPAPEAPPAAGVAPALVDPVQWWGALTQQFQSIATQALKDMGALDASRPGVDSPSRGAGNAVADTPAAGRSAKRSAASAANSPAKSPAESATTRTRQSAARSSAKREAASSARSPAKRGAARPAEPQAAKPGQPRPRSAAKPAAQASSRSKPR